MSTRNNGQWDVFCETLLVSNLGHAFFAFENLLEEMLSLLNSDSEKDQRSSDCKPIDDKNKIDDRKKTI